MRASERYEPSVIRWRRRLGPWIKKTVVPHGSVRRRWWWNRLFVQVADPYFFGDQTKDTIYESLKSAIRRAESVLAEARHVVDDEKARGEHVERRATALQGAVAIAATFVLAGGAVLVGVNGFPSSGWRSVIAGGYLLTVVCLAATGLRALRATVRVHAFEYPDPDGVVQRATENDAESQLRRAAELLYAYSRNQPIVDYQVAQMRAAGHWFAAALAGVLITSVGICGAFLASPNKREAPTVVHRTPVYFACRWHTRDVEH